MFIVIKNLRPPEGAPPVPFSISSMNSGELGGGRTPFEGGQKIKSDPPIDLGTPSMSVRVVR